MKRGQEDSNKITTDALKEFQRLDLNEKRTATALEQLEKEGYEMLDLNEKRTATKIFCHGRKSRYGFVLDLNEKRTATDYAPDNAVDNTKLDLNEKRTATHLHHFSTTSHQLVRPQ